MEWMGLKRPFCLYMASGLPESGFWAEPYMGGANCEVAGEKRPFCGDLFEVKASLGTGFFL